MKGIQKIFMLCFIAAMMLSACKKEESVEKSSPQDDGKVCWLWKVTTPDQEYTEYTYNSEKQLMKMDFGEEDAMSIEFTYNSDDVLSEMVVTDSEGTHTTQFEYNDNGQITGAVSGEFGSFTYEFDHGMLVAVNAFGNIPNVGNTLLVKTQFTYSGDNVSEMKEFTRNFLSGDMTLSTHITYAYDHKKNPFYQMGIQNAVINIGFEQFRSKNNVTKRTVVFAAYPDGIGSYEQSYTYNSSGYPVQSADGATFTYL